SWALVGGSIGAGGGGAVLPARGAAFGPRGRGIWMLLRDRARGEHWLALMRLIADARAGVLPESTPAALLARATAVRDDSADTVTAHAFAYSAAFHQHRDDEAAQRLETRPAHSGPAPPAVREARRA